MNKYLEEQEICRVAYALNSKKLRAASVSSEYEELKVAEDEFASKIDQQGPWCGGGLATIVGAASKKSLVIGGVEFCPWTEDEEGMKAKRIHLILHKLTNEISMASTGKVNSRLKSIEDFVSKHPKTRVVDPFSSVGIVANRIETNECIKRLLDGARKLPFTQPKYAVVREKDSARETLMSTGLRYPVICKPEQACGVATAHAMNIVLDEKGFTDIPRPFVMQQYFNHDASLLKVYVIGSEVMVSRRSSLPNFTVIRDSGRTSYEACGNEAEGEDKHIHVVPFDSRKPYPTLLNLHDRGIRVQPPHIEEEEEVEEEIEEEEEEEEEEGEEEKGKGKGEGKGRRKKDEFELSEGNLARLERVATELGETFGLSLFGFDVIVPSKGPPSHLINSRGMNRDGELRKDESLPLEGNENGERQLLVVDVNFFPSYKEVSDFPHILRAFLRRTAGLPPWQE